MTNGEMIKTIFPNEEMYEQTPTMTYYGMMRFDTEWWNAEYKEPTTKNDLAVDCVSREKVWYMITNGKYPNEDYEQFIDRLVNELSELPSVTPQLSSELEKNSKELEKDFGELDCISRADAIRVASGYCHPSNVAKELAKLPSVTPQETGLELEHDHEILKAYSDGASEVLDKIRDEIETKYGYCDICEYFEDYDYEENDISEYRPIGDIADILQIIDKYKAEMENKE